MKRKIWNKTSVPTTNRNSGHWIRIQPKSGSITFSSELSEQLKLSENGINFIQDEDRPADWYLEISHDSNAFSVRKKKSNSFDRAYIIQSTALAKTILQSIGLDVSTRFLVGAEPVEKNLFAIITKSAKTSSRLKAA